MKKIAYHGIPGAFSYLTALKAYGEKNDYYSCRSFREVFEMIEQGLADYGIVPIENSLAGSIYENYDLLNKYEVCISGEYYTKIEHCLVGVTGNAPNQNQSLKDIKKVISHPKALEQCGQFFSNHPWIEAVMHQDTARAAAEVAKTGDPSLAAISSAEAAHLYGLAIMESGIEDDPNNYTRFISIAKKHLNLQSADKCSLIMHLEHVPGALAEILQLFSQEKVNLTKIESRPLRGSTFEYVFYADFEFIDKRQQEKEKLLQLLSHKVKTLKPLGFYNRGTLWMN